MAELTDYEAEQVKNANRSGKPPVVFVHGLWLLPEQLGPLAHLLRGEGLRQPWCRVGPTIPTPSRRPTNTPRCSRTSRSARSRITSRT